MDTSTPSYAALLQRPNKVNVLPTAVLILLALIAEFPGNDLMVGAADAEVAILVQVPFYV